MGSSLDPPILREALFEPEELDPFVRQLESAPIREVRFHSGVGDWDREELALHVFRTAQTNFVRGVVEAREPNLEAGVEERRSRILEEFSTTVFSAKITGGPPVRGPFGETVINLKPGAVPVRQRPFQIVGERRTAWLKLTDELVENGLIEPGVGSWNLPSFPVPKKTAR